MSYDGELDLDKQRLAAQVEQLAAKFDTVQVFVTRHDPTTGDTVSLEHGAGNWYARRGQVSGWCLEQDELAMREADEDDD